MPASGGEHGLSAHLTRQSHQGLPYLRVGRSFRQRPAGQHGAVHIPEAVCAELHVDTLTSCWVTGWPGTRLATAAYIGTVSSAAAMALAPTVMDRSTRTTPITSREPRHEGLLRGAAVGLGRSAHVG